MSLSDRWHSLVNRHVEGAFRARPDGTLGVYPFGSFSHGFLIQTAAESERARALMRICQRGEMVGCHVQPRHAADGAARCN